MLTKLNAVHGWNPFINLTGSYCTLKLFQNTIVDRSHEDFIKHYKKKYELPLPIWIATELWDFGLLSNFYQGMKAQDKSIIALKYGFFDEEPAEPTEPNFQVMASWLRSLNHARNIAAHHGRLWNRNLVDRPKLPPKGKMTAFDPLRNNPHIISRIYGVLCILSFFLKSICPRSSWDNRLIDLLKSFPQIKTVTLRDMGFPLGWEKHEFWNGTKINTKLHDLNCELLNS